MNIPIIVIAYNRDKSLKRLLNSLASASYKQKKIDLIISIDKTNNHKVYEIADSFNWIYGNKTVIKNTKKLGLREHVLNCGDLVFDYDAIIMLEDDLIVSKSFYNYATQSVDFYKNDDRIGGISLYTYRISEFANQRTFIPMQDSSDVYFMKVPSSWGQIWTKKQWRKFRNWYNEKEYEKNSYKGTIPDVVLNWGESSWKKYFYMYLAQYNKYIVYPRVALSTNMADIGTHHKVESSTAHQAILMNYFDRDYIFKKLDESICKYDAFMESEYLEKELDLEGDLIVDYYGIKTNFSKAKYLLSTRKLNYKKIKQWSLSLKPYELNILYNISGEDLFLYKLNQNKIQKTEKYTETINLIKYELPGLTREKSIRVAYHEYKSTIKRKIKKLKFIINKSK